MQNNFKQTIQIGKNPNGIIKLPCVEGLRKNRTGNLVYQVKTEYGTIDAVEGDLICEDYNGRWHVTTEN